MDGFIESQRDDGSFDSSGVMTTTPALAREKLRRFQLEDEAYFLYFIVQACVMGQASFMDFEVSSGKLTLLADPHGLDAGQAATALKGVGAPEERVKVLAQGLNAAVLTEPKRLSWTSHYDRPQVVWPAREDFPVEAPDLPPEPGCVYFEWGDPRWDRGLWESVKGRDLHMVSQTYFRELFQTHFRWLPARVRVNGQELRDRRWPPEPQNTCLMLDYLPPAGRGEIWLPGPAGAFYEAYDECLCYQRKPWRYRLAIFPPEPAFLVRGRDDLEVAPAGGVIRIPYLEDPEATGTLKIFQHGVWVEDRQEQFALPGVEAVVCADHLLTDLSGRRIIIDEAYQAILDLIQQRLSLARTMLLVHFSQMRPFLQEHLAAEDRPLFSSKAGFDRLVKELEQRLQA